jgi:hypothetical protein
MFSRRRKRINVSHFQDMIMRYAYDTDSDTHLTIRIPIPVPGYGTASFPVSVAAPCISGKVRLDGRFETCKFQVSILLWASV